MAISKKYVFSVIQYALGIALLIACGFYVSKEQDTLVKLKELDASTLSLLFIFNAASVITVGMAFREALKMFSIQLPNRIAQSLGFAGGLLDLVLPARAGLALRATYLTKSKAYPLTFKVFGFTTLFQALVGILLLAISGSLNLWTLLNDPALSLPAKMIRPLETLYAVLFIVSTTSLLIFKLKAKPKHFVSTSAKSLAIYAATVLCFTLRVNEATSALGVYMQPKEILFFSLVQLMITAVPIVPNGLGLREIGVGIVSGVFGHESHLIVLSSMIDRTVQMVTLMFFGGFSLYFLKRKSEH